MNSASLTVVAALALLTISVQAADCPPGDRGIAPLHREPPVYPPGAMFYCIEGEVRVRFRVAPDGTVVDPEVVHGMPPGVFDREALATVASWLYQPACRNGQAVLSEHSQTLLEFRLDEELVQGRSCPEKPDPDSLATLTEIAGWYVLLSNWLTSRPGVPIPQVLIPELREEAAGDERRLLVFHRDAIARFVAMSGDLATAALERNMARLLDFERAADDPELRETRALLEAVSRDLMRHTEAESLLWQRLGEDYINLAQNTALDSNLRAELIYPFVGNPNSEPAFSVESATAHTDDLKALVDLLAQNGWTLQAGQVRFQQSSRQRQFETLLNRIETRNAGFAESAQRGIAGFRVDM